MQSSGGRLGTETQFTVYRQLAHPLSGQTACSGKKTVRSLQNGGTPASRKKHKVENPNLPNQTVDLKTKQKRESWQALQLHTVTIAG